MRQQLLSSLSSARNFYKAHFRLSRTSSNYDSRHALEDESEQIPLGVWVVVAAQFVFYGVTNMMLPALFKHCQGEGWDDAPAVFAHALLAAGIGTLVASFACAAVADYFDEKKAYQVVVLLAFASSITIPNASNPYVFIAGWATLKAVSEGLRGVKNAYMGKHAAARYNYVSNFALNSGLVSSVIFPAAGAFLIGFVGEENGLIICGCIGAAMHGCLFLSVCFFMQGAKKKQNVAHAGRLEAGDFLDRRCVECQASIPEDQQKRSKLLCKKHFDHYENCYKTKPEDEPTGCSFITFKASVIVLMCLTVVMLQFSVNITVMALFQPLMVHNFDWGSTEFSALQSFMSILGVVVTTGFTVLAKRKAITAQQQTIIGGFCFFVAIGFFVIPPISKYRLAAAQVFGFLSQIIFQGPWNVVYGQIMTKDHLTSLQMSVLGAMIAVGQSAGCAAAPYVLPYAGAMAFTVVFIPVIVGVSLLLFVVRKYDPAGRAEASHRLQQAHNEKA